MMNNQNIRFNVFDQVQIITTKNVRYLSAPPGSIISPKGIWQVSAAVGGELLLVKGNVIIKIPTSDVLKIVDYDVNAIVKEFGSLSDYGKTRKEDVDQDQ